MFRITQGKGFSITFENGVTVSVQFGLGNYCAQYNKMDFLSYYDRSSRKQAEKGTKDAEMAIIGADGDWLTKKFEDHYDDVLGYVSPKKVLEAMIWAEAYKGE